MTSDKALENGLDLEPVQIFSEAPAMDDVKDQATEAQIVPERLLSAPVMKRPSEDMVSLYISVEKAMNLPLMRDPLASSFNSPFVKTQDTKSAVPNSSCTLRLPSCFSNSEDKVFQTCLMWSQTSPLYGFKTRSEFLSKLSVLDEVKSSVLEIICYHYPAPSFANSSFSREVDEDEKEVIGTCRIPLSSLFTLPEVYGWYPIEDGDEIKGQLMVRLSPSVPLATLRKQKMEAKDIFDVPVNNSFSEQDLEEVFEWDGENWVKNFAPKRKPKTSSILKAISDLDLLPKNLALKNGGENSLRDEKPTQKSPIKEFSGDLRRDNELHGENDLNEDQHRGDGKMEGTDQKEVQDDDQSDLHDPPVNLCENEDILEDSEERDSLEETDFQHQSSNPFLQSFIETEVQLKE